MKFHKIFSIAFLCSLGVSSVYGLDITNEEAGFIDRQLTGDYSGVTALTLKGEVDASDLYLISQKMPDLTSLDLKDAVIVEYRGTQFQGRSTYPAATIPFGVFSGMKLENVVVPSQPDLKIADAAFMNTMLTELALPENVTSVGQGAFAGCDALVEVVMPTCQMGDAVFADCKALKTVKIAPSITEIPAATFKGCISLAEVEGSEGLVVIGDQAFEGDASLKVFGFGSGLRKIGASAFAGTGLTEVTLSEAASLTAIGEQSFAQTSATKVEFPDNVTTIGDGAFFGNTNLEYIELPPQLLVIGQHAFNQIPLKSLTLPESLEEIGNYALLGQNAIDSIALPSTLSYIGDGGMGGMTALRVIDARTLEQIPALGQNVWEGVDQEAVTLQLSVNSPDFESAAQWQDFTIDRPSGIADNTVDNPSEMTVKGRFVGTDLQIESKGAEMDVVRLFDTAGRMLLTVEPRDTTVVIDTADYAGGVFIVNVVLDDKTSATLKLARR